MSLSVGAGGVACNTAPPFPTKSVTVRAASGIGPGILPGLSSLCSSRPRRRRRAPCGATMTLRCQWPFAHTGSYSLHTGVTCDYLPLRTHISTSPTSSSWAVSRGYHRTAFGAFTNKLSPPEDFIYELRSLTLARSFAFLRSPSLPFAPLRSYRTS